VHIVVRGHCELAFPDGGHQPLAAGDLVILSRGDANVLRSPGSDTRQRMVSGFELAVQTPSNRLRAGAPGAYRHSAARTPVIGPNR
jgi:hypothetical protein